MLKAGDHVQFMDDGNKLHGEVLAVFIDKQDAARCVIEDGAGRLLIKNPERVIIVADKNQLTLEV